MDGLVIPSTMMAGLAAPQDKIVLYDDVRTNVEVISYQDSDRMLCSGHVNQVGDSRAVLDL